MKIEEIDISEIDEVKEGETIKYLIENNLLVLPSDVKTVDDIFVWYDSKGPKKELFERALHTKELFYQIFTNENLYNLYNPSSVEKEYIDFLLKNKEVIQNTDSDIISYIFKDINNYKLENIIFNYELIFLIDWEPIDEKIDIIKTFYPKCSSSIKTYMKYLPKLYSIRKFLSIIKEKEIEDYFNEEGPTDLFFYEIINRKYLYADSLNEKILSSLNAPKKIINLYNYYSLLDELPPYSKVDDFENITSEICSNVLLKVSNYKFEMITGEMLNVINSTYYLKNLYNYRKELNFSFELSKYITSEDDIIKYFTDVFPSKALQVLAFDKNIDIYGDREKYKEMRESLYKEIPEFQMYLKAEKWEGDNQFYSYNITIEQIKSLFSNPPTTKIFEDSLFDYNFNYIFKYYNFSHIDGNPHSWKEFYNPQENIKQYIEFVSKTGKIDFIDSIDDINQYFDEYGPKLDFIEKVNISNSGVYRYIFDSGLYKKYNLGKEVEQFVLFRKSNSSFNFKFIENVNDIKKYFDEKGPKDIFFLKNLKENVNEYYINSIKEIVSDNLKNFIENSSINRIYYVISKINLEEFDELFVNGIPTQKFYELCLNDYNLQEEFSNELSSVTFTNEEKYKEALNDYSLFEIMFKNDDWEQYFNATPSTKLFINYVKKCNFNYKMFKLCYKNIDKYFDSFGPKKILYEEVLFSKEYSELFSILFDDNEWEQYFECTSLIKDYIRQRKEGLRVIGNYEDIASNYEIFEHSLFNSNEFYKIYNDKDSYKYSFIPNKYVLAYINFVKKTHVNMLDTSLTTLIRKISDIEKYFDEDGPNIELINYVVLNNPDFGRFVLYSDKDLVERKTSKAMKGYINFFESHRRLDYIDSIEKIEMCFDENGPQKELFDIALFDEKLFKILFTDEYIEKYQRFYSSDKKILSYIRFYKKYGFILSDYINNNIDEFFTEDGLNNNLYSVIFSHKELLKQIIGDDFSYPLTPSAKTYYDFIKKYDVLFDFITRYEDIEKYFDENGYTEKLVNYFSDNKEYTFRFLVNIQSNEIFMQNLSMKLVNIFRKYIITAYSDQVPDLEEKFDYLFSNIGLNLLFNINDENILSIIKRDKSELDKFFELFDKKTLIVDNPVDTFSNSIIDAYFNIKNSQIVHVFSDLCHAISSIDSKALESLLLENFFTDDLSLRIHDILFSIKDTLNLSEEEFNNFKNLLWKYKTCIVSNDTSLNVKELLNQIHDICKKYKTQSIFNFRLEQSDILRMFGMPYKHEKKDAIEKIKLYFLNNIDYETLKKSLFEIKNKIDNYESLTGHIDFLSMKKEEFDLLLNLSEQEFNLIVDSLRSPKRPDSSVQKLQPLFKRFIAMFSSYCYDNETQLFERALSEDSSVLDELNVNKQLVILLEPIDLISTLKNIDFEIFLNTICTDENKFFYDILKKLCKTYYLGRLPKSFSEKFQSEDFGELHLFDDINNLGVFITRFKQILEKKFSDHVETLQKSSSKKIELKIENEFFSFMDFVDYLSVFNSDIREIRRMIGTSEYFSLVLNRPPNSGGGSCIERAEHSTKLLDYLYMVDEITVPSDDFLITNASETKSINFIVGNRTNASNICHGERTGACMRIGGAGEGLFVKCITDKNWFHIRLEDPDTHEFISRVSGFRNGNTVYLNQLREVPADSKYTNKDLQEFIKKYAEMLIEQTKNSEFPIENVFINDAYAMENVQGKKEELGYEIQQEYSLDGVEDLCLISCNDIWTDVRTSAILLATTEEGKKTPDGYAPLRNGPENAVVYKSVRDKIYGFKDFEEINLDIQKHRYVKINEIELIEKINRVYTMKQKLLGKDYRLEIEDIPGLNVLDYTVSSQIVDGYASADWYVYVDSNYEIHSDYISEYKKDDKLMPYRQAEQAKQEMEYCKQILINKYNLSSEVRHAI